MPFLEPCPIFNLIYPNFNLILVPIYPYWTLTAETISLQTIAALRSQIQKLSEDRLNKQREMVHTIPLNRPNTNST